MHNNPKQAACHTTRTRGLNRKNILLWLGFAAWWVGLFILSSIPGYRIRPMPFASADKVVHMAIFFLGTVLLALAFYRTFGRSPLKTSILVFVTMVLIGVGDEYHQIYTPGRSGNDPGDLLADAIGALIGIGCVALFHGKRPAKANLPTPVGDRAA